ncbi:phosphatase PAP2 family protein [Clostridium paraputrificum]|uniref:phosphatase PAP2 family protein n=1 Tax=Clostridium TaxID=1485 RepID=UPI003D358841
MEIIKFIQQFSNEFLDVFFTIVTYSGAQTLGIFVSIILFWCYDKKLGYRFLYGVIFSFSLNNSIKGFFNSPRPIGVEGIISSHVSTATGSSFPSGHSQGNATSFTLLMSKFKNKWLWTFGILMIILVPLSRLYFGVHWPIDVFVGTLLGIISVIISNKIFNTYLNKGIFILIISLVAFLSIGLLFPSNDLYKAIGSFSALVLGIYIEDEFIGYNPNGSKSNNIKKIFIGLTGALIIYFIFSIFNSSLLISFVKYFAITLYAIVLAPLIFIRLKLNR